MVGVSQGMLLTFGPSNPLSVSVEWREMWSPSVFRDITMLETVAPVYPTLPKFYQWTVKDRPPSILIFCTSAGGGSVYTSVSTLD